MLRRTAHVPDPKLLGHICFERDVGGRRTKSGAADADISAWSRERWMIGLAGAMAAVVCCRHADVGRQTCRQFGTM